MANSYFYGIYGIRMIWHGCNADPEISYKNMIVNYYEVEDALWDTYQDENPNGNENDFEKWVYENKSLVKDYIYTASGKRYY